MFRRVLKISVSRSLLAAAGIALAGCSSLRNVALDDTYYSPSYDERYPIKVEKAPTKLGVVAHAGSLTPEQINAVAGFANDAKANAQSRITIKYPSGAKGARQAASDIAELMVQRGVSPAMIVPASYAGGGDAPIQIVFLRKVAVTKPCGDWSSDLGSDRGNDGYENFGCAIRNNMAAMVSNPEDFEQPRAVDPNLLTDNRMAALKIYMINPQAGTIATTKEGSASSGSGSSGGGGDSGGGSGGGSGG